ncbi:hypothetical protein OQX61_24020 [Pedobacter sp. PLR]|uniref:hypothetical protein n=1 Tax=Pedobacter sp. PLR TaxID=2994465 RepID=UPI002247F55C|nr:hypothetical protein [Pedobacter sp. PLR]MCX2454359.1 hypothetical protein [Pedobacter sp. PLR]
MCNFSIEYPQAKDDMVEQLKAAIESQTDGVFRGDVLSGEFSFSARGFELAGGYSISGDLVEVTVSKKPWLLSCRKIESEIRKYLEGRNGIRED